MDGCTQRGEPGIYATAPSLTSELPSPRAQDPLRPSGLPVSSPARAPSALGYDALTPTGERENRAPHAGCPR